MFYAIKNLLSTTTFAVEKPWESWKDFPNPANIKDKKEIEKWRGSAKTSHAFLSGVAGLDPLVRITQNAKKSGMENPPTKMQAFIADYDATCLPVDISNITARPPSQTYLPTYLCDTFRPGFRRLIWVFEQPILLGGTYGSAKAFIQKLANEIRADKWLPGFDEHCLDPHMYYAIGENWVEIENSMPIPHHILQAWAMETDIKMTFSQDTLSPPPIEDIAQLVSDRFPGKWSGEFTLGARGVRFWDAQADNPTAAVVMAEGMRCFTGSSGFVTWREIFGGRAIDELIGEQQSELRNGTVFDGRKYWYEFQGEWQSADKTDFAEYLMTKGMDNRKPRGGGLSRVGTFMNSIRIQQRVEEALPFIYRERGRILYNGEYYLNTSKVKVLPPAPPLHDQHSDFHEAGKRSFPWIEEYLSNFFSPVRIRPTWVPDNIPDKDVQLMHFLAWHHRFYKSAFLEKPLQGHALIIGGHPSSGKGFLSNGFIGKSMGGFSDGSQFLLGQDQWTADILKVGVMTVDDDHSGDDIRSHRVLTTRVKKLVANTQALYNKKFGSSGRVPWPGRVVMTCNLDPESLRILPDMTQSNADKIMLFMAQARRKDDPLPDYHTLEDILNRELPHYCRWLLDFKVPAWLLAGDERFWVRAYHHPTLLEAASEQGSVVNVLEMLREVYDEFIEAEVDDVSDRGVVVKIENKEKSFEWSGPVRQLYKMMKRMEISHIDKLNFQQIGSMLGILSSRGFKIKKLSGQDWHIVFDQSLLKNTTSHLEAE